ncbi:translocation and assembly module TamB [Pararhizobium capsulatum DSM 1112]|uniref:Translocation and assembly module TamB n=1 Tax=Pararhizobium capsulatum DSM 1112 TaxID=1121113 RepID=A0ABU0BHY7_9HYPH|nr:translocation/assembly module TamB domain-containing protein [Pararhizobium capsulatum]MDQ0317864.1 translocation and assembly module TamB [Pararhizobium capsulatum DSM 1112]
MNRLVRILKAALRWFAYVIGVAVVAVVLVFLFAGFTAPGARMVATLIEKYASTPDQIVRITDPSALLTGDFTASTVTLFDSKGVYAEIRDVAIDWSPTALFSSRFDAQLIKAGSARLERLPIPSQETKEVRSTFALPLDVKIAALDLPEIVTGKEIAGTDQFLSLTGNLDATNTSIATSLAVAQRDQPDAKAIADIVFNPSANTLKLDATVNDISGGLLSRALELPGTPAVQIAVKGEGPLSDWAGKATASLDGTQILDLNARHIAGADGSRNVALTGGGTFASLLPENLRPLFEGNTDIDLAAVLYGGTRISIERGTLSSGALDIAASGTYDTAGKNDLQATLSGKNGPVELTIAGRQGDTKLAVNSAMLSLDGQADAAKLQLSANLAKATLPQGEIDAISLKARSDSFDLAGRNGPLQAHVETGAIRLGDPNLARLVKGPAKIDATLSVTPESIGFNPVTLESASVGGTLSGAYNLATGALETDFKLFALPDTLPPAIAAKVDTTIAATGKLQLAEGGAVSVSNLAVKSGTLELAGNATLEAGNLTAAITGTLPDLGKLLADASGTAAFKIDTSGAIATLGIKAEITSDGATLAGRTLSNLVVTANGTANPSSPLADITATGAIDGQTIDVKANLASDNNNITIPTMEATIGNNKLNGSLSLTPDFQPNGQLTFNLPDLALLAAMAGQKATGDLAGSVAIESSNGKTSATIRANGSGIERDGLKVVKPVADISIADLKALAITGTVSADEIVQGENRLTALKLGFAQQAGKTDFTLNGSYDETPLSASGALSSSQGRAEIALQSLTATLKGIPITLPASTAVAFENGAVQLKDLAIATKGGTLTVNGTAGQSLDLTATLVGTPQVEFTIPQEGGEIRTLINGATATLKGPLDALAIDATADVASLSLPQGEIGSVTLKAHSDAFNVSAQSGVITTRIDVGTARFADANIDRVVKAPIAIDTRLNIANRVIAFEPVTIDGTNLDGALNGRFALDGNMLSTTFSLEALPGALPPAAAAKFDAPIAITGRLATGQDGAVDVSNLQVKSTTVEAAGSVSLKSGQLQAALAGEVPNLGKVLADASGVARFKIDATGPLETPTIKAEITSSGATMAGRTLSDLVASIDATANPDSPQAKISATGAISGQAINVKADLVSKDGRTSIPTLEARIGDNTLTGSVNFTQDLKPNGSVTFNFPDVALLAAMAGEKASGDIAGSATIQTTDGKTSIALKASGSGIKRGDLVISKPAADITIADLSALAIHGNLSVEAFSQGVNRLTGLKLDFDQQGPKTNVSLDGNYDGAPLSLRGDVLSAAGKTTVNLASFSAAPRKIPVRLAKPTTITVQNSAVTLDTLTIGASGGTVTVNGTAGDKLGLDIKIAALPAALINTFVPSLGAEGAISGTVGVKGTTAAPAVSYDLDWNNANVAQARSAGVGALNIKANGQFANNTVDVRTTMSGAGGLSFRGGGKVGIAGNRAISMKFDGDLPFSLLSAILSQQGFTLTGNAKVDVAIAGTASAPLVTGTITTSGARFVDVRRNLAITNLAANVALDGRQARINELGGRLASGGNVSATGTVGIQPGSGFPADLSIRLDNANYIDGTLLTAHIDGTVTIKGSLIASPVVGGKVTITKAAITIPEKLPPSLSEIDIKHRHAPADVRRMQADLTKDTGGGGKSSGINFDLIVSAPNHLFIRGRGIDAELGGDLTIRGTASQPVVAGGFEMRRGRLEILGKRLTFTDGNITFGGDLVPALDLDATSSAGSTTITVNVGGLANNPTVTFASSPALPQDEILAQLIFNRSLSNLSAFQIAQLASAVAELAGGRSNSLLSGLRNKLGVDDLDISTDASGGAQVTAGKYLNDRTYLELQSGSEAGGGKAIINLDVGRGVKLRGEAGAEGTGGGIFYEKEY